MVRRLVGIDLGIASSHTVRVLDEQLEEVCRRRCEPSRDSLERVRAAALAGAPPGTILEVVLEPTGPAWLPVAVFFAARGDRVYRVSSAKAADLRRFLSRHAKSNSIDADTLARLPLMDPRGLAQLELPGPEAAALDRRVRACDRLTRAGAEHKVRIKDLVRQLMPLTPLTGDLGQADLAVLERWADPRTLLAAGPARLTTLIVKASHNHQGAERAQQWRAAAAAALELYADHPAVAFTDLAAEVATEVRLLRAAQVELAEHAAHREEAYRWTDPAGLARSLPGLGEVGGPVLSAVMGRPGRFATGARFKAYAGLAPKTSRDRRDRPQGPTDEQGRLQPAARHARARRRHRPQARPSAREGLLHPDGRTRRRPPQGQLRRGRPAGRARAHRHGPRHALRHLRHRRPPRHRRAGPDHHCRAMDRPARGPRPPTQPKDEDGEGPSARPRRTQPTRRPSPRSIVNRHPPTRQTTRLLTTYPR